VSILHARLSYSTIGAEVVTSYPRLTLDFHTNKRLIDEVVRVFTIMGSALASRIVHTLTLVIRLSFPQNASATRLRASPLT
jgi:hypothetical protein